MYESTEGQAAGAPAASPVDAAFAALLDELFADRRVTYARAGERPVHYGAHRSPARRHRRFVLRAGTDLDDPR